MRIVFVAGPYRAATENGVHENIGRARAVALPLWRPGVMVFCPHLNSAFMGGAQPDRVFLDGALAMLAKCDAVVLVPGWERSTGTQAEIELANRLGIPVYESADDFLDTLEDATDAR